MAGRGSLELDERAFRESSSIVRRSSAFRAANPVLRRKKGKSLLGRLKKKRRSSPFLLAFLSSSVRGRRHFLFASSEAAGGLGSFTRLTAFHFINPRRSGGGKGGEGGPLKGTRSSAVTLRPNFPWLLVLPLLLLLPCKLAFRPRGWREGVRKHEASVTERKKVTQSDAEQKGDENSAAGAGGTCSSIQFFSKEFLQVQRLC